MPTPDPRRWWALAVIALAQFIVIMDTSIIGVALPDIQRDLEGVGMTASFVQEPGLLEPYSGWVSERPREAAVRPVASTWLTARPWAQRVGHDEDAGERHRRPGEEQVDEPVHGNRDQHHAVAG